MVLGRERKRPLEIDPRRTEREREPSHRAPGSGKGTSSLQNTRRKAQRKKPPLEPPLCNLSKLSLVGRRIDPAETPLSFPISPAAKVVPKQPPGKHIKVA